MSSAMMIDEDEAKELESGDDFIHVMVTDPHKVGDGMSSYIGELFSKVLKFLKNLVSSLKKIHKNLQKFVRMAKNPSFFSEKKILHV